MPSGAGTEGHEGGAVGCAEHELGYRLVGGRAGAIGWEHAEDRAQTCSRRGSTGTRISVFCDHSRGDAQAARAIGNMAVCSDIESDIVHLGGTLALMPLLMDKTQKVSHTLLLLPR